MGETDETDEADMVMLTPEYLECVRAARAAEDELLPHCGRKLTDDELEAVFRKKFKLFGIDWGECRSKASIMPYFTFKTFRDGGKTKLVPVIGVTGTF